MKKIINLITKLVVIAILFTTIVIAKADFTVFGIQFVKVSGEPEFGSRFDEVYEDNPSLEPGTPFQVDLMMENLAEPDFAAVGFYISYDPDVVEPIDLPEYDMLLFSPYEMKDNKFFPGTPISSHWNMSTQPKVIVGNHNTHISMIFMAKSTYYPSQTNSEKRIISLFFRVKENATAGSEIKLEYGVDKYGNLNNYAIKSTTDPYFIDNNRTGKIHTATVAGAPVIENNTVSKITMNGNTGNGTYDYLSAYNPDITSYNDIVVPSSVGSITFSETKEDAGTIVSHGKVTEGGTSLAGFNLDYGMNYFKSVVKNSSNEVVKEYNYKVYRLSNSTNVNLSASGHGDVYVFTDNKTTVKSSNVSLDILASRADHTHAELQFDVTAVDDTVVSNKNVTISTHKSETPFKIRVWPEDALSKYDNVPGINDNRSTPSEAIYKFVRASNDNSLKEVVIKNGTSKAELKKWSVSQDTYDFEVPNEVTGIDLEITPNHLDASIMTSGLLNKALVPGMNTFTVQVNAADGTQKFYTFNINRVPRSNADLSDLSIKVDGVQKGSGTPPLVSNIELEYKSNYSVQIVGTANTVQGAVISSGGTKNFNNLPVGLTTHTIVVKAEDGTTKTYTINITVKENTNSDLETPLGLGGDSNNWLVDPGSPIIDNTVPGESDTGTSGENITIYRHTINVKNSKKTFGLTDLNIAIPTGGTLVGGTTVDPLLVGDNSFTFDSVSQDGKNISRYIITVNRGLNNIASLERIEVTSTPQGSLTGNLNSGLTYSVASDVLQYTINGIVASGDGSTVDSSTVGTFNLDVNPKVHKVKVLSEDGTTTKEYSVTITRSKSADATLKEFNVNYGVVPSYDILPMFVNKTFTLDVETDIDSISIDPIVNHVGALYSFTVDGVITTNKDISLKYGQTKVKVDVTSETGVLSGYTLIINRAKGNNAKLNYLKLDGSLLDGFDADRVEAFDIGRVSEHTKSLDLTHQAQDINATVSIVGNNLEYGDNTVQVIVTAHDGITKMTYSIKVYRELSSSASIPEDGLLPNDKDGNHEIVPPEDSDPYRYKVYVPYDTLTYSKNDFVLNLDKGSVIEYENDEITLSRTLKNEFKFTVIAPNGTNSQTYILEIIHMDSDRPKLVSISINGVIYPGFDVDASEQIIPLDGLIGSGDSSFQFDVVAGAGVNIAYFNKKIEVAGKHTINQEITLTGNLVNVYKFVFTRTMSNDDTLSDISIDGGVFTPEFTPGNTGPYQVDVGDKETINVSVDPNNPNALITGAGDKELVPGKNQISINVESEDKSNTNSYNLVVYRDLALTVLKIGDINIDISNGVLNGNTVTYTIPGNLPAGLVESYITAVANHSSVTITGQANKIVVLDNTDINFSLKARDGESVLNVVVQYDRTLSSDARLDSLKLLIGSNDAIINFNPDTETYNVVVPHDFTEIVANNHIKYTTKHPNTKVTMPESMQIATTGSTTFTVDTESEDGTTKSYNVIVSRLTYNFLESLAIRRGDGHIEEVFIKENQEYNALIYSGNEYFSFEWTTLPGVSVKDANTLINISTETMQPFYNIVVIGENGEERTYRVNISKGVSTRLQSMDVTPGVINFNPDTKNYEVYVSIDTNKVSITDLIPEDSTATIRDENSFNNITLNGDRTKVEIYVENQGYEGKYTVTFIKVEHQTNIDKITANDGNKYWEGVVDGNGIFQIVVDHGVDLGTLEIGAVLEMPGSSYEIQGPLQNPTNPEIDKYLIIVTDKNGIEKEYTANIRNDESDNNFLRDLIVNGSKVPGFNRYATEYEVYLGAEEDFVIVATAEDENATITISNHDPISDQDVVSVTVMSDKGNVRTYNVLVHKEKANTAILDTLSLKEATLSPLYNKDRKDYYVTLPFELDYINVLHTSMSGNTVRLVSMSTVDGNKVSDIPVGNSTIDVVVEAEDGSEFTYVINVHRQVKSENYLEDLSVEDTHDHTNYSLSPTFDKEKTSYTVMLPHNKNQVSVKGIHGDDLVVYGLDNLVIPAFPYIHTVRVVDDMNRSREYSITFTQAPSEIPTLSNLSTDKGPLDPVFEASKSNYHIDVAYETQDIELLYTKSSSDQIVKGAGSHTLNVGRNVFEVVVTSGTSSMTYTVTVNRARGSAKLDWLEVSEGTLSPAFSKDTMMYTVTIGNEIESITVNAGSDNTEFEVSGSGMHALEVGMNVVEVVVDAGSGTTRSYYVVIEREAPIVEPPVVEPDEPEPIEPVDPYNGDLSLAYLGLRSEELNEVFDSSIYEYTANLKNTYYEVLEVIAVARNPIATVEILGNNNFSIGEHDITIRVSLDDEFQDTTITVFVEQRFLESDIHEVGVTYIQTVKNRQTVLDLKNQMLNENEFLRIYYDGQLLDDTDIVGTGAIIKLVVDDTEYDSKEIVVLGDLNGDGDISIADLMKTQSFILGNALSDVEKLAADVTLDNQIMINDFMKIQSHILLMLDLHN